MDTYPVTMATFPVRSGTSSILKGLVAMITVREACWVSNNGTQGTLEERGKGLKLKV